MTQWPDRRTSGTPETAVLKILAEDETDLFLS